MARNGRRHPHSRRVHVCGRHLRRTGPRSSTSSTTPPTRTISTVPPATVPTSPAASSTLISPTPPARLSQRLRHDQSQGRRPHLHPLRATPPRTQFSCHALRAGSRHHQAQQHGSLRYRTAVPFRQAPRAHGPDLLLHGAGRHRVLLHDRTLQRTKRVCAACRFANTACGCRGGYARRNCRHRCRLEALSQISGLDCSRKRLRQRPQV